jgi:hypothetical protein
MGGSGGTLPKLQEAHVFIRRRKLRPYVSHHLLVVAVQIGLFGGNPSNP